MLLHNTSSNAMANKQLFASLLQQNLAAMAQNRAGGKSYMMPAKHALAQYASTGSLNGTFYASAETQLDEILALCNNHEDFIPTEFIAQTALYARERACMKDVPALLVAILATRSETAYLKAVFPRVVDTAKVLRSFVQIMRSGATGRQSLGTLPKRLVLDWFQSRTDEQIFASAIGNDPSLADVIKMVHPKPETASRRALYGYLLGKPHDSEDLPAIVREYEAFKRGEAETIPDVPFQMLTSLSLSRTEWSEIALRASWQMLRMNLNTFARHGVFEDRSVTAVVCERLRNSEEIRRARVFPYQLLAAFTNIHRSIEDFPESVQSSLTTTTDEAMSLISSALQDAMEIATENVPTIQGKLYVCVDVSGSMQSPVTGVRKGATSTVRCIDAAALVASALLRKNADAEVIPFEQHVVKTRLNPRDSVMTNAQKLASINGGGTNCSAALRYLNDKNAEGDTVIFVSDNESWMDVQTHRTTAQMHEWQRFRQRNPEARLVCVDIQPNKTTQASERKDILNVGGFSDDVFRIIAEFAQGTLGAEHWIGEIERINI
jgi:60 kDa SS-A/Ro ribonucleoprotein